MADDPGRVRSSTLDPSAPDPGDTLDASKLRTAPTTRLVTTAYRRGWLPPRGYGQLFSRTPAWLWGGRDVIADTAVGDMVVPLQDPGALHLLTFGTLADEQRETAFMRRMLPRIGVMFDIGANYGWYARMARDARPDAVVAAVEANPDVVPYLRHNAGAGVHVFNAVATDHLGEAVLHRSANSTMSSPVRSVGGAVTVAALTVDEIAARVGRQPDLIKCDVEGGEMAVLRGAEQVRAGQTPPLWLIEVYERYLLENGDSYAAMEAEFSRFGPMAYFCPDGDGWLERLAGLEDLRGGDRFNVVAVPASRLAEVSPFVR